MIEAENLTKYYGPTKAIEDVTFKVESGEILGLLGPNGAGKTTIMRILTGYFSPTNGCAKVCGFNVVEEPLEVKKRIGYLSEILPLYYEMVVLKYLDFVAEIRQIPFNEARRKINKVLEVTRIEDVKNRVIGRLSRGYKQRVGLAQALLHDPQVLILDEPTIGLDPKQIIEIRQLIKSLAGERTIILSSHILPEVSMTCEKIVIMDKGKVIAVDTQEELTRRLKGAERIIVKVKGNEDKVIEKLSKVNGVKKVENQKGNGLVTLSIDCEIGEDLREDIFKTVVLNNWVLLEMKTQDMSLEEVFLKLTTKEEGV